VEGTSSAKGGLAKGKRRRFSATPSFPAIRLMLSLSTDPIMSVESYDLVSAFLVPKLEGSFTVIRLPPTNQIRTMLSMSQ